MTEAQTTKMKLLQLDGWIFEGYCAKQGEPENTPTLVVMQQENLYIQIDENGKIINFDSPVRTIWTK